MGSSLEKILFFEAIRNIMRAHSDQSAFWHVLHLENGPGRTFKDVSVGQGTLAL